MWYFHSPTLVFGEEALDHLETIEGTKCFIVTDPGIKELGLLDVLTEKLEKSHKVWQAFTEVEPDPKEETVYEAAEQCKAFGPDLIIGIGGGSSLDVAKGVWVLYEHPEFDTVDEIHPFHELHTGIKAQLVAIPTTSGTGAETTWAVIITRENEGQHSKLELGNKKAIPSIALIDPVFPRKMPSSLTAATGFDALAHSIEAFVSTWHNPFSDALAIHAVRLIFQWLPQVVKKGADKKAREHMHNAAAMAGLAFGNAQVNMGHALGHAIGAVLHVPHGEAVGLSLSYAMEYCINDPDDQWAAGRFSLIAKSVGIAQWCDTDKKAAQALVEKVKWLQEETGLPKSLQDLGILEDDLNECINAVVDQCMESASTVMTPRNVGPAEFAKVLQYMHSGKSIDF